MAGRSRRGRARRASLATLITLATLRVAISAPETSADHQRVRTLLAEDRWEQALQLASRSHAEHPDDRQLTVALAEALFRAGRLEEIGALLEPVCAGKRPPGRALILLARLRAAEGRTAELAELLGRAVGLAPRDPFVLYWAGDLAPARAQAREWLERYLERGDGEDPDRLEAARGSLAAMEALGDRPVWVPTASPESLELPLTHIWDESGRTIGYVVQARLGDAKKPVRLLIDTGTHGLVLVQRMAAKRGFESLAEATQFGSGGDRRHEIGRGLVPSLALGELRYASPLVTTTRQELDPTGRFHGLLGLSVFGGYRVTLDLKHKRMRLQSSDEPIAGEPYWWVSGQLLVRGGTPAGSQGLFVLDTGAAATVLSDAFAAKLDASPGEPVAVRALGGRVRGARVVRGVDLRFQSLGTAGRQLIAYDLSPASRLGGVEVSGLLGLDLLAGQRLVLDTANQRIVLE